MGICPAAAGGDAASRKLQDWIANRGRLVGIGAHEPPLRSRTATVDCRSEDAGVGAVFLPAEAVWVRVARALSPRSTARRRRVTKAFVVAAVVTFHRPRELERLLRGLVASGES